MPPHDTPLIFTLVAGFGLAFLFALAAHRLKLPIVGGYLLAGVAIGPHTPGFTADAGVASELAEIGVILLMFGVGLHFSLRDLMTVRAIAVPGAILGILSGTALGYLLATFLGWSPGAGLVFGLCLSVASTVVLMRALRSRNLLDTDRGRIAVGWLIVEDIVMVLTLVLLPAVAPLMGGKAENAASAATSEAVAGALAFTVLKLAAFVSVMLVVGRRVIPWLLHYVAYTGSRELFRLAVLAIALGVAFGAVKIFGVSFALGAFLAGMILAESTLSQQAANESLPLRDAFAVLFFVSAGMLFDPSILVRDTASVLATVSIIMIGKPLLALGVMLFFKHSLRSALTIAISLAQIGEFSFILSEFGLQLGLLGKEGRDLVLAAAILTILLNPLLFVALDRFRPLVETIDDKIPGVPVEPEKPPVTSLEGHTILVGFGAVGSRVADALARGGGSLFVIDDDPGHVADVKKLGIEALEGNAAGVLAAANPGQAKAIMVAVSDSFEAGQVVAQARAANPSLFIVARAHSPDEAEHLTQYGADKVVFAEQEIADAMVEHLRARQEAEQVG